MEGSELTGGVTAFHARLYGATHGLLRQALPTALPNHLLTVVVLAACGTLNLLSVLNVLWLARAIDNPYLPSADTGHYDWLWTAVVLAVEANVLLGRRQYRCGIEHPAGGDARQAEFYILASLAVYALTIVQAG